MEETVLIFAIPAFFILVCLLFISANHFYYKIKSARHQERATSKISVINITNMANSSPPSPKKHKKQRRKRSPSPNSKKTENMNRIPFPDHFYLSPVIQLDLNDCPPSYQSLYAYETDEMCHSNPNSGKDNFWLHPSHATTLPNYGMEREEGTKEKSNNNQAAVLHM